MKICNQIWPSSLGNKKSVLPLKYNCIEVKRGNNWSPFLRKDENQELTFFPIKI